MGLQKKIPWVRFQTRSSKNGLHLKLGYWEFCARETKKHAFLNVQCLITNQFIQKGRVIQKGGGEGAVFNHNFSSRYYELISVINS